MLGGRFSAGDVPLRPHPPPSAPSVCRACGARIVSRTDELREEDVGTGAGLFEVKKIGDEYFAFITDCKEPKACTIVLRGASKEILAVSSALPPWCHSRLMCERWQSPCRALPAARLVSPSTEQHGWCPTA